MTDIETLQLPSNAKYCNEFSLVYLYFTFAHSKAQMSRSCTFRLWISRKGSQIWKLTIAIKQQLLYKLFYLPLTLVNSKGKMSKSNIFFMKLVELYWKNHEYIWSSSKWLALQQWIANKFYWSMFLCQFTSIIDDGIFFYYIVLSLIGLCLW